MHARGAEEVRHGHMTEPTRKTLWRIGRGTPKSVETREHNSNPLQYHSHVQMFCWNVLLKCLFFISQSYDRLSCHQCMMKTTSTQIHLCCWTATPQLESMHEAVFSQIHLALCCLYLTKKLISAVMYIYIDLVPRLIVHHKNLTLIVHIVKMPVLLVIVPTPNKL